MRISDWSSDVCSSDLLGFGRQLCPGGINAGQYVVAQRLRDIVVARPRAPRGSVETGAAASLLGIGKIIQCSQDRKSVGRVRSWAAEVSPGGQGVIKQTKIMKDRRTTIVQVTKR